MYSEKNKYGDWRKCPACNESVADYQIKCNSCNQFFYNIDSNKYIQLLSEKLEYVDRKYQRTKDNSLGKILFKHSAFGIQERERIEKEIIQEKSEIILNFPIPKTKEDILDFIFFIGPKIQISGEYNKVRKAWEIKFHELKTIGLYLLKSDDFKGLIEEIERKYHPRTIPVFKRIFHTLNNLSYSVKVGLVVIPIFIVLAFYGGKFIMSENNKAENKFTIEHQRLESISNHIDSLILIGKFVEAELLTNNLHWQMFESRRNDNKDIDDNIKYWDEIRNGKIEIIKQK